MKYCFVIAGLAAMASAHMASWNKGMYCKGGPNPAVDDPNTNTAVTPLFNLTYDQWFQQRVTGCNLAPPPDGEFLELPAGKSFMTELADNRAVTTLSYGGKLATEWGDGKNRTIPWRGPGNPAGCLADNPDGAGGDLHTTSIEDAAGTAWAISYEEFDNVNLTNLVVFSVLYHTPFFREAWYDVPADLPACPEAGCYCAWLWVPNGCGQPNMYMESHRCNVTGAATSSTKKLATPSPPEWCADDVSKCVTGAKQMIAWNQAEQNNVQVPNGMSPGYNYRMGFQEGAQKDIFEN